MRLARRERDAYLKWSLRARLQMVLFIVRTRIYPMYACICHSTLAYKIHVHSFDRRTNVYINVRAANAFDAWRWSILTNAHSNAIEPHSSRPSHLIVECEDYPCNYMYACVCQHCTQIWPSINIIIRQRTENIVDYRHDDDRWSETIQVVATIRQLGDLCRKELNPSVYAQRSQHMRQNQSASNQRIMRARAHKHYFEWKQSRERPENAFHS